MANLNCSACEELRQTDPNLIVNGFGETECTSLQNDTGLNPSSGNDDCTDLNNMNDCLVGNMADEVDAYEVCDWKTFMKKFIPNLWTALKGIICAICGLWTSVHTIEARSEDLCKLIDHIVSPELTPYGILPLATAAMAGQRVGHASSKMTPLPDEGSLNPYTKVTQNIGIKYAQMTVTNCTDGRQEMIEWIMPDHYLYTMASSTTSGEVLYRITKAEAQATMGISDYLWTVFEHSSWTWRESELTPSRQVAWMKISVGTDGLAANEMGVIFMGCSAPNNSFSAAQEIMALNAASAKAYRHYIS